MLINRKLLCKKPVFAINYNYRSVKYDLCKRDWYCDVAHHLGKVKFKYMSVYEPSPIIGTLLKLCVYIYIYIYIKIKIK